MHELRHPEKRGPEVVVADATVFRAIAESRRCTQKLSYGYEPVNLCLSDVLEVVLQYLRSSYAVVSTSPSGTQTGVQSEERSIENE